MPLKRDKSLASYLRNARLYEPPKLARTVRFAKSFLADRTIGRAFATACRLSSVCL